jgi:TPP-dependent pyruvate/acetoin dehydrogenase alpha subunit
LTDLAKISSSIAAHFNLNEILSYYVNLKYIREVEIFISENYFRQQFRCPVHLSIGQEAVAVGVSSNLKLSDKAVSTHRSHAHYLAKGGSLYAMFSELMGNPNGCCGGRGGSMHLFDENVGFLASIPIVGSSTPIAAGLAYAEKLSSGEGIAVSYVGDAVLETGAFYETLNLAAVKKLPLLIVLEDNGFSTYADKSVRAPADRNIRNLVEGMGLSFLSGIGDDVNEVSELSRIAIQRVRESNPVVLSFDTFRRYEHCGPNIDDSLGYRSVEELNSYVERDPILIQIKHLVKYSKITLQDLEIIDQIIKKYISSIFDDASVEFLDGTALLLRNSSR